MATLADFAQQLFGPPFGTDQVIKEEIVPFTEGGR
jgi:hypothetical protein